MALVRPLEPYVQRHSVMGDATLENVQRRLGHTFSQPALLRTALTHASAVLPDEARQESYQRLEFLGDRVLGLAVARLLFERFPEAPEGQLSRALADMVRKETCADVAVELDLGAALRIGKGEKRSGLARKEAVLGDACEAVLGAIAMDAGYERAAEVVRSLWTPRLPALDAAVRTDAKTALQEWAHSCGLPEPKYRELERSGPDHAPVFRVAACVDGLAESEGSGRSKRAAERAAAETMLMREGVRHG